MTTQVLCEGYLTKSPPEHKINRARWCKRYFQLCNFEGEILLRYFKDSSCTKLKGTINLRECEQVDQGLSFETKSKLKDAFIFDIVTQRRKYFLVTESEDEMLHWVRSICTACGFQSEDSISTISDQTEGPGSPSRFAETPLNAGSPPTTTITQPPLTNGNESYIDIADCETGNPLASSNGLPPKLNAKETFPQQVLQARQPRGYDTMSSTSSSAPSDSAPSPPNSRPTSQIDGGIDADIYDVPPVRTSDDAPPVPVRPVTTIEESTYKVVPASKDPTSFKFDRQISLTSSNRGSFSNSDDLGSGQTYDLVPSFNDRRSSGFESVESNGPQSNYETPPPRPPPPPVTEDIYQVPPPRQSLEAEMDTLYDIPPTSPQIDSTYDILPSPMQKTPMQNIPSHLKTSEQISKSTDDLARSFEEISQQNANQSFTNGDLEHSTYDPVPAMDLNASIGSNSSFGSVFKDLGPSSTAMEAPPRPAKPHGMCPSTPPSSIDETYVAPVQANHRFSPNEMRQRLTSIEMNNPPSMVNHQHMWMDQVIQPPVKYVNTKRSGTAHALARPNSSFNPKGYIPMRSNTVSAGSRATFPAMGFQNGQPGSVNGQHPPGSYMAMQGSSESPKGGLGAPISEESYMHMQSQNDGNPEMYTMMNPNAPAVPRRPPRQSTSSIISISSTASGDSLPPPIDRRNKPRSTDSAILIPEMVGLEGSFYATGPELPPDFPVQNPRTKSFSKRPSRHRESSGAPGTPPRPHRSTHSSSSSHTEHDSYSIPPSVDESYVFSDPAPPSKPRIEFHQFQTRHSSIDSTIHAHPSPNLPPRSHTVEYLELDHDSDSPSTLPRPPKPTSPKDQVEYIHLDLEKTKALQDVMQNREECYRPKNNDGGTLKK